MSLIATPTSGSVFQPGQTTVSVEARSSDGQVKDCSFAVIISVPPVLSWKFHTVNTGVGHLGELWVYAIGSAGTDSAQSNADGTGSLKISSTNDQCVFVRSADHSGVFSPQERTVCKNEYGVTLHYTQAPNPRLLVGGQYNGMVSSFSLSEDAFAISPDGIFSFILRQLSNGCYTYGLATWPKAGRPYPGAIYRGPRSPTFVADSDSVAIWRGHSTIAAETGITIFRPANFSEIHYVGDSTGPQSWVGLMIMAMPNTSQETGWGSYTSDIVAASLVFDVRYWHILYGAAHTMGHVEYNIGHSTGGLMNPGQLAHDPNETVLGIKRVAVIQTFDDDAELVRQTGAKSGIPGAATADDRAHGYTVYPVCAGQK